MDTYNIELAICGSFHQGDEYEFQAYSRGRQCVTNSIAAIAFSKISDITLWNTSDLDNILREGDLLYQNIRPQHLYGEIMSDGYLNLGDIPSECHIFKKEFAIHQNGNEYSGINEEQIKMVLQQWNNDHTKPDVILVMGDRFGAYASGLIQHKEKLYYFDAHSHSYITKMPSPNGRSVLLKFDNISMCANYIFQSASMRHATQISLWKITIKRIYFYSVGGHTKKILVKPRQSAESVSNSTCENKNNSTYKTKNKPRNVENTNKQLLLPPENSLRIGEPVIISCDICSNKFVTEEEQLEHKLICQEKDTTKTENSTKKIMSLDCNICSKPMDNEDNLLKHQISCKEKQRKTTQTKNHLLPKKKNYTSEHYVKTTHHVQLTYQSDQIKNKLENLYQRKQQLEYKIKNRQHEISKLQTDLRTRNSAYQNTQIKDLQSQIIKLSSFLKEITHQQNILYSQRNDIQQQMDIIEDELNNIRLNYHQNKCNRFESNKNNNNKRKHWSTFSFFEDETHNKRRKNNDECFLQNDNSKIDRKRFISSMDVSEKMINKDHIKKIKRNHMINKRSLIKFKQSENNTNSKRITSKRMSKEYRDKENLKNTERLKQKRASSDEYKQHENEVNRDRMAKKRLDSDYRKQENTRRQHNEVTKKFGNNILESIDNFLQAVSEGPIYVCSSCHQTQFPNNVVDVRTLNPGKHQSLLETCLTDFKSVNNKEWLCMSCKREIYEGQIPKLSKANKVGFPKKPSELDLNGLEEFLAAPLSAFMKIRSLPVCGLTTCGQKLILGNVVHVPNNVAKTVKTLPRTLDEMDTIALNIKRKLAYKTVVFSENIRPLKVIRALEYLIKNSKMYKSYNIELPAWLDQINSTSHDYYYFVEGHAPPINDLSSNLVEDSTFEEVTSSERGQGNMDTMLIDDIYTISQDIVDGDEDNTSQIEEPMSNKIYTLAPGEGQIPVFKESRAEYLCFPTLFCGQERPSNNERTRPVYTSDLFKAELRHEDTRVCLNIPNIFWKAKYLQIQHITSKVTLALRRLVGPKHNNVTAERLLDKNERETIQKLDEGYHIYRSLRNSPPYFEKFKKDVLAMVRQLGIPTLFFSLSSADTSWLPLLQCLGKSVDKITYTEQYIKHEMTFEKKCQLVSSHPACCSRYFRHRVQQFIKYIVMGEYSPFGQVIDFVHRVEFQKRGSPHIHGLLWISNTPKFGKSTNEEISTYIDSCISCSTDVTPSEEQYLKFQVHKHSRTCKKIQKGKPVCRFGIPWPPMKNTTILYPSEPNKSSEETRKLQEKYTTIMEKLKKLPDDVKTHNDWLTHIQMDENTYLQTISSVLKRPKIFLKRNPHEHRVNSYMKGLLGAWQANHDIQFILDPYQCVTYVCDYMTKSQKGMSDLLHAACEEAKSGNMGLRESVRHIGNKFLNAAEEPVQACCYEILQLPLVDSTRKKEYINTSPPEERIALTKSLEELEQLNPKSKDVTYKSNIDRYMMRPNKLLSWCLADFVSKIDIEYPKKIKKSASLQDEEQIPDPEELEDHIEHLEYSEEENFPIQMRNGIVLKLRRKNKVIRFRNYRIRSDPEEYYRERLMLYIPWKKECDILGDCTTYEEVFKNRYTEILTKLSVYEPMSSILELALEEYDKEDSNESLITTLSSEHEDENSNLKTASEFAFHEPDNISGEHLVDIGPALGITPVCRNSDDVELIPNIMNDEDYFALLCKLNQRQQEFHTHIMQQCYQNSKQVLCALHGGAGTGKSTVIHAIHQGLYRLLNKLPGEDFSIQHILLLAPTGKAAYNIHGVTIHKAFIIPANQKLEYKALTWDHLNTARNKFNQIKWILLDEFSMVGNNMLRLIHLRLQEIKGNQLPFGGINIICVGDLFQLQPVMQQYIFMDINNNYGPLAINLWRTHFSLFELTEIMRQKEDKTFAQLLNRLRIGTHTKQDICILEKCKITNAQSFTLSHVPHFFPTKDSITNYNNTILKQSPGQIIIVTAIDSAPTDISNNMQKQILIAAQKKDLNSAGNLPYELVVKIDQLYDLTANVAVDDGMVNGAECYVRAIENNPLNPHFPKCIWVEFIDKQIGQNIRKSCNNQHFFKLHKTWTPVYSIRRSFIVKRDQKVMRTQFPLQLGCARTIHKAQSSTYQEIVVDMSTRKKPPKHFWEHMHYVAFSRCTSLKGLHIVDINEENICQSEKVKHYLAKNKRDMELCYIPSYEMDNYLKISYNNICSFMKKKKAIINNYHLLNCDIIILAETWLSTKVHQDIIQIPNFHLNRMDSTIVKSHRGLVAYTTKNNTFDIKMTQTPFLEICECDVLNMNQLIHIIGIYRPPSTSIVIFKKQLYEHINKYDQTSSIVILGDFNINIQEDKHRSFLLEMKSKYNLEQLISQATTLEGTTIDLIFTNISDLKIEVLTNTWSSHHTLTVYIKK